MGNAWLFFWKTTDGWPKSTFVRGEHYFEGVYGGIPTPIPPCPSMDTFSIYTYHVHADFFKFFQFYVLSRREIQPLDAQGTAQDQWNVEARMSNILI